MKATLVSIEESVLIYPCLRVSTDNVVFFTAERKGIVVYCLTKNSRLGYYSDVWAMTEFRNFSEAVKLEN